MKDKLDINERNDYAQDEIDNLEFNNIGNKENINLNN